MRIAREQAVVTPSFFELRAVNVSVENSRGILDYYDGYLVPAEALPEMALAGLIAPLDHIIMETPDLNWFRIARFFRGAAVLHGQDTYGVPLGGAPTLLYYRKDVFDRLDIPVPATWEQLLATAQRWQGVDVNGDGQPDWPFCYNRLAYCGGWGLQAVAAPYLQTSRSAGYMIDPASGSVLFGSAGWIRAMQVWQALAELSPPEDAHNCIATTSDSFDHFAAGTCMMTFNHIEFFKFYAGPGALPALRSNLGVALVPGSAVVLNRTSGQLVGCSAAICPTASYEQDLPAPWELQELAAAVQQPVDTTTSGGDGATAPPTTASRVGTQNGTATQAPTRTVNQTLLVNRAAYMLGGVVGVVSRRNPRAVQAQVVDLFSRLTSPSQLGMTLQTRPGTFLGPFRTDHWSPASAHYWTTAGYEPSAVSDMLLAVSQVYTGNNQVSTMRLPGQPEVEALLTAAAAALDNGTEPAAVAARLDAGVPAALDAGWAPYVLADVSGKGGNSSSSSELPGWLLLYRVQVGYTEPVAPVQPPLPPNTNSTSVSKQAIVVIAVVLGLVAALTGVVALEVRNKRRHKDLLGRVKPPLGDPDTTIVVASIQDFDELWEALISDASERALQQFSDLVDDLLSRFSGYRAPSEEEDVVVAFHCPRDACEFALELQRGLLAQRWPRHVLEMEQFRPHYLAQRKKPSFSQSYGHGPSRVPLSPLVTTGPMAEDDDKLFTLDTRADNVRSFGEQCVASWQHAEPHTPDAELAFCGIRARLGVCAVGFSRLGLELEPGHRRYIFSGEAVEVAAAAAAAAQGGMVLIPQSTFRQLHLEMLAEQCLFCHLGEYQLTSELPPMDLYLALDRQLLGRLALFGPLSCYLQWSQGAFAAPVHSASMVFTHVVGVQTLLAWNYDLMQDVIETFTRLAQVELQQAGGYLVEHVEGFMLTAFHSPADAILWGLRMQELMLKEDWPDELLSHELCEEVTVTVPVRGGEVTSATVFRGPRLKTGIDIGQVLARLHTMTGRMTYRGKVMNRAARISAAASSGQVLCSAEAWESCTANPNALRLVSGTSLGLFQLKGIAERIEVFHCTYQRQFPAAASTRRSSTVSQGMHSSDNHTAATAAAVAAAAGSLAAAASTRRRSTVVLSTTSHHSHHLSSHHTGSHRTSHHTGSHRTSHHTSAAFEHASASASASEALGHVIVGGAAGIGAVGGAAGIGAVGGAAGRRPSAASSAMAARSSMGPVHVTDMLTLMGVDHSAGAAPGSMPGVAMGHIPASPTQPTPLLVPIAASGIADAAGMAAGPGTGTGPSGSSPGSRWHGGAGGGGAAAAAVAPQQPLRTRSARSRRPALAPAPGSSADSASEPQVSLLDSAGAPPGVPGSPGPSVLGLAARTASRNRLAVLQAAAAAPGAADARLASPKAAAQLERPGGGNLGGGGSFGHGSSGEGDDGGEEDDEDGMAALTAASVAAAAAAHQQHIFGTSTVAAAAVAAGGSGANAVAAVYAMLPSVVLSAGVPHAAVSAAAANAATAASSSNPANLHPPSGVGLALELIDEAGANEGDGSSAEASVSSKRTKTGTGVAEVAASAAAMLGPSAAVSPRPGEPSPMLATIGEVVLGKSASFGLAGANSTFPGSGASEGGAAATTTPGNAHDSGSAAGRQHPGSARVRRRSRGGSGGSAGALLRSPIQLPLPPPQPSSALALSGNVYSSDFGAAFGDTMEGASAAAAAAYGCPVSHLLAGAGGANAEPPFDKPLVETLEVTASTNGLGRTGYGITASSAADSIGSSLQGGGGGGEGRQVGRTGSATSGHMAYLAGIGAIRAAPATHTTASGSGFNVASANSVESPVHSGSTPHTTGGGIRTLVASAGANNGHGGAGGAAKVLSAAAAALTSPVGSGAAGGSGSSSSGGGGGAGVFKRTPRSSLASSPSHLHSPPQSQPHAHSLLGTQLPQQQQMPLPSAPLGLTLPAPALVSAEGTESSAAQASVASSVLNIVSSSLDPHTEALAAAAASAAADAAHGKDAARAVESKTSGDTPSEGVPATAVPAVAADAASEQAAAGREQLSLAPAVAAEAQGQHEQSGTGAAGAQQPALDGEPAREGAAASGDAVPGSAQAGTEHGSAGSGNLRVVTGAKAGAAPVNISGPAVGGKHLQSGVTAPPGASGGAAAAAAIAAAGRPGRAMGVVSSDMPSNVASPGSPWVSGYSELDSTLAGAASSVYAYSAGGGAGGGGAGSRQVLRMAAATSTGSVSVPGSAPTPAAMSSTAGGGGVVLVRSRAGGRGVVRPGCSGSVEGSGASSVEENGGPLAAGPIDDLSNGGGSGSGDSGPAAVTDTPGGASGALRVPSRKQLRGGGAGGGGANGSAGSGRGEGRRLSPIRSSSNTADGGTPSLAAAAAVYGIDMPPEAAYHSSGNDDNAALAAAFGVGMPPPPPPVAPADRSRGGFHGDLAAAAAAFGVGPPPPAPLAGLGDYNLPGVRSPTPEQLAEAMKLLGESHH
eukprot:XP_001695960.1 predicted protein [Chlamydomonas reinhardtii]